jgi:hypothetical protein
MAIKASGSIGMVADIVAEFGGTAPYHLSDYVRGGSIVPNTTANANIPTTTSAVKFTYFYSAAKTSIFTYTGNYTAGTPFQLEPYIQSLGWNGTDPLNVTLTITADIYGQSAGTSNAILIYNSFPGGGTVNLINNANVIGGGGDGGGYLYNILGQQIFGANTPANAGSDGIVVFTNSNPGHLTITNNGVVGGGGGGGAGINGGGGAPYGRSGGSGSAGTATTGGAGTYSGGGWGLAGGSGWPSGSSPYPAQPGHAILNSAQSSITLAGNWTTNVRGTVA